MVVVGVDGSAGALAAVRWAAGYARATGTALRLLHAASAADTVTVMAPLPVGVGLAGLRPARPAGDQVLAAAAAEANRYAELPEVSTHLAAAAAVPALLDASAKAGLVVLGSPGHGRVAGTLLGSVAARVVADARCPVVVVRGEAAPSGPIVVAVDTSENGEPALRFAFREAARRDCALFAVHAWQPPVMPTGALAAAAAGARLVHDDLPAVARRSLAETIAPWRAAFPDVAVHERLLAGPAERAVTAETAGAALVVVGSRGRAPLTGLLFGSTSQALLDAADCPVAVVRQAGPVSGR